MLRLLITLSLLTINVFLFGQAAIGDWTYYGSYNTMQVLETVGNSSYVANENGAFYMAQTASNETTKLTKTKGFVDSRVSYLEYSSSEEILIIGYVNGQIDLLKGNKILNVNDIYRNENISTSKRINHISTIKKEAYLCTDFGIVVLDITTGLINETYRFIGANGAEVSVYSSTIKENSDSLFIISNEGLQTASLINYNLQDFHNWTTHDERNEIPTETLVSVATLSDTVYLASEHGLYALENQLWENKKRVENTVSNLTEGDKNMTFCYADTVLKVRSETSLEIYTSPLLNKAIMARVDNNDAIQVTDSINGLVLIDNEDSKSYFPTGPRHADAFRIKFFDNKVTILSGGYSNTVTAQNSTNGFYDYSSLTWTNYESGKDFTLMTDFVSAASNTITNLTYYASFGSGLLVKTGNDFMVLDQNNSLLDTATGGKVFIPDIKVADDGNMWLTNYSPNSSDFSKSLYKIDTEGNWTGYSTSKSSGPSALEFVIDQNQVKWLQVRETGSLKNLLAFDPETGQEKLLTQTSGGLPASVTSLETNKKGEIYIGTENGIALVYNPQEIFTSNSFTVTLPIFGSQNLLKDEVINAIKVDGGGRLWVGTKTGLFFFNEDLTEQVAFYNSKNSPLLSNEVSAIGIDGNTGEIFITTEDGVFSFMGDATEATNKNKDQIVIFPNPVRPDYTGVVAIRGLVSDASVKITDINANLVHDTDAEGGTATWDVKLLTGERAATGVYLVFTSDEEGKETFIGKIAIISE